MACRTGLTDAQFALVAPFLPPPRRRGRPRATDLRRVVDAVCDRVEVPRAVFDRLTDVACRAA